MLFSPNPNPNPNVTLTPGTPLQAKLQGGIVDMEWVYRFVNIHLHGLGKPVPLELDSAQRRTSASTTVSFVMQHGLSRSNLAVQHGGIRQYHYLLLTITDICFRVRVTQPNRAHSSCGPWSSHPQCENSLRSYEAWVLYQTTLAIINK